MFFPHFGAKTNITLKSAGARRQGGSAPQWGTATTSSDQPVLQSAASYWSVSYPSASRLQRCIVTAMCTILVTLKIIDIVQVLFLLLWTLYPGHQQSKCLFVKMCHRNFRCGFGEQPPSCKESPEKPGKWPQVPIRGPQLAPDIGLSSSTSTVPRINQKTSFSAFCRILW